MISKNSRRITGAVEDLKQGSFTATKGIDETAPALASDTVLHSVNLDVDRDGGLILRKPLIAAKVFPKYYFYAPKHIIPITDAVVLLIYQEGASCGARVLDYTNPTNPTPLPIRIEWVRYDNYLEVERPDVPVAYGRELDPDGNIVDPGFYNLSMFNLEDITFTNLTTNVLVYGAKVNYKDAFLCDIAVDENGSEVYTPTLIYEDLLDETYIFRPLQIIPYLDTSKVSKPYVKLKIGYAKLTELTPEGEIPLDANLNSDSPYALRDSYDKAASSIDGILAYVPSQLQDGKVVAKPDLLETSRTPSNSANVVLNDSSFLKNAADMYSKYASLYLNPKAFNYNTSVEKLGLQVSLTGDNVGGETVRDGTLKCDWSDSIYYSDCKNFITLNNSFQWDIDFSSIKKASYTKLCQISCNVNVPLSGADGILTRMSLKGANFKIPIRIEWNAAAPLTVEFNTTVNSQYPNVSNVPLISYTYLNPNLWTEFKKNFLEIFICRCLGFNKYTDGTSPFTWDYTINPYNSGEMAHVAEDVQEENSYIFITLYRYVSYTSGSLTVGMHPDAAICFRIPRNTFEILLKDFTIQNREPITITLKEMYDQ